MIAKTKLLAAKLLAAALAIAFGVGASGCDSRSGESRTERWATTENTSVQIDWNAVNEAYKQANGPADLERRINEIYKGDEVISISVADVDARTQIVTGFFDRNASGTVDEAEKIFTIRRDITGDRQAQFQTTGHGAFSGYASPFFSIVSGMVVGSMLSNVFAPNYAPAYTRPYTTPGSRIDQLAQSRSSYRAANPEQFQRSRSGRTYDQPSATRRSGDHVGGGRVGGGRVGGGRFGLRRAGRPVRPARLEV
jgi:hypothetical protein